MTPRKRQRHPRFDGYVCIVKGCTRVELKHGLCRNHWSEVPLNDRLRIMSDVMIAAHKAAHSHDGAIAKWAANYRTGVMAAQGKTKRARAPRTGRELGSP